MKNRIICVILSFILTIALNADAQSRKGKTGVQATKIKAMVDSGRFVFIADYAMPLRGGQKILTSEYDVRVSPDSVITFLPYYGRAYLAPNDFPIDGGIKFTTTNFKYTTTAKKNGTWQIRIKPKDNNITDWRDVQQLYLTIGTGGYATLDVISSNRDPISFNGYIDSQKPVKSQQKGK